MDADSAVLAISKLCGIVRCSSGSITTLLFPQAAVPLHAAACLLNVSHDLVTTSVTAHLKHFRVHRLQFFFRNTVARWRCVQVDSGKSKSADGQAVHRLQKKTNSVGERPSK
jgi:hypothetical protein